MAWISLLNAAAFIVYLYIAVSALSRRPRILLNWSCAGFALCFALWSLEDVFHGDPHLAAAAAERLAIVGNLGRAGFGSLFVLFVLALTHRESLLRRWPVHLVLALPPAGFTAVFWLGLTHGEYIHKPFGWITVWPWTVWSVLFYLYYLSFMLYGLHSLSRFAPRTSRDEERRQARLILATTLVSLAVGTTTDIVLPNLFSIQSPEMAGVATLAWAIGLYIGVKRYGLMSVTPQSAAGDTLAAMADAVLLLDPQGRVTYSNAATRSIFGIEPQETMGKPGSVFFAQPRLFQGLLDRVRDEKSVSAMEADGRTGDGRVLSLSVSARSLLDRSGEARGTVLVLRDVADLAKAEAARRLSDERYRSFVQNFPGIAFRGDLDLSLEFVHGAVESITGYPAGQFLSQPNLWRELTHPDDRARVQASTDRLRTEPGCTMTREYRIVRQDGTTRWLRVSLSNVCDAAGTPVLVQGSAYDVTSERKAMAELAELSQLRESIIDNANVWMMVADTKMNVLVWNKAAERISGYTRDEVVGSRAVWSRLYPDPDYREQLKQFGRPQVERGREVAGLETPIVCKNGEKRFVSLTWRPIVSPSGTISAIVILGQDVTEEKRALAYLRESEEKYRTLVERAIDGIVIVQDGVVKYANPTLVNISGRSLTELGSSPFSAFLAPSEIPKVAERYRRRMAGESVPSSYETTFLRSDGVAVPVELNAGLTTYEGRPADLVLVRDITDRRRALEQEARHVENMSLLSRAALELVEMSPDEDVYRFVGERIKDASGAMLAFVNSYDRTARTITVRAALGLGPMTEAVIRALGRHPVGMVMPVSAEPYRELLSGQLVEVTGGLHALSLGTIPQPVCDMIESLLGMGQAFSIGFAWEGELYGNTTFVLRRGQVMRGPEVVQALVRQCAIALRRRQVEDTLEQSERSFRALADGTRDGILVADEAGRWAYVNASAAAALGWPRDELVGRNVSDVLKPEDVATVRERFARWIAGEAIPPSYSLRLVKKDGSEIRARLWAVRTVWNGLPVVMATVRFGTSVEPNRERGA